MAARRAGAWAVLASRDVALGDVQRLLAARRSARWEVGLASGLGSWEVPLDLLVRATSFFGQLFLRAWILDVCSGCDGTLASIAGTGGRWLDGGVYGAV